MQSVEGRAWSNIASSHCDQVKAPFQIPFGNVTQPHPYPHGIVQAKVPLFTESTARFFLMIATGVCDLIFVDPGEYFSSCFRVNTSEWDDAVSNSDECWIRRLSKKKKLSNERFITSRKPSKEEKERQSLKLSLSEHKFVKLYDVKHFSDMKYLRLIRTIGLLKTPKFGFSKINSI